MCGLSPKLYAVGLSSTNPVEGLTCLYPPRIVYPVTPNELRLIRRRLGLTQAALADRVGISANSIARQERGDIGIAESVARLIRQLDMKFHESQSPAIRKGRVM